MKLSGVTEGYDKRLQIRLQKAVLNRLHEDFLGIRLRDVAGI